MKSCKSCKYAKLSSSVEPCYSCDFDYSKWVSKDKNFSLMIANDELNTMRIEHLEMENQQLKNEIANLYRYIKGLKHEITQVGNILSKMSYEKEKYKPKEYYDPYKTYRYGGLIP